MDESGLNMIEVDRIGPNQVDQIEPNWTESDFQIFIIFIAF